MAPRTMQDFASLSPEERAAEQVSLTAKEVEAKADLEENNRARVALDEQIDSARQHLHDLNRKAFALSRAYHEVVGDLASLDVLARAEAGATATSATAEGLPLPETVVALS